MTPEDQFRQLQKAACLIFDVETARKTTGCDDKIARELHHVRRSLLRAKGGCLVEMAKHGRAANG